VRFTTYLSYALTDLGDLERAEEVLDAALGKADELADAYSRVRLYWSVARLNEVGGRPAAALDYIRRAIALLDVTDDTLHLARAHLLAGAIMLSQGRASEAGTHHEVAEKLFGASAEPVDLSGLYADQARRATALGDATTAVAKADAAVAALEGDEYPHEKGRGLWALAEARALAGDVDGADQARRATALGDATTAVAKADAAVAALEGDEYPHEKGRGLWALAEARALAGDVDGADQAYREATMMLEAHGHRREYIDAYRAWGKFLRRAGREEEALEVLERTSDLAAQPLTSDTQTQK
jgi:tetratricopeptide (TPR) repeat protein